MVKLSRELFGNKTANLCTLQDMVLEFASKYASSEVRIDVPNFVGISHDDIQKHISHSLDFNTYWGEFCQAQKTMGDSRILSSDAIAALEKIRNEIAKVFSDHPIHLDHMHFNTDIVMVRSTGKEDSANIANQGGNDSFPSLVSNLNASISKVVQSYFSEKSIAQRLSAGDKSITDKPFMPVLIQEMIRETTDVMVHSGVVYNIDGGNLINSAPGFGELVVNNKGNTDTFYISESQNMIYANISNKDKRIITQLKDDNDLVTTLVNNDTTLKTSRIDANLNDILYFNEFLKFVKVHNECAMDIEFVYVPNAHTWYVVQQRPIPMIESDANVVNVDGLRNDGIEFEIVRGTTMTSNIKHIHHDDANLVENSFAIERDAPTALMKYLRDKNIKGVVIEKRASETSHEIGAFTSSNVPVVKVRDIEELKERIAATQSYVVIDPQLQAVIIIKNTENFNIQSYIKKGVFYSTLDSHVTPYEYAFENVGQPTELEEAELSQPIGDLIAYAQNGDSNAFAQVVNFIYSNIKGISHKDNTLNKVSEIAGTKIENVKPIIQNALYDIIKLRFAQKIDGNVFKACMFSGAELLNMLNHGVENRIEYLNAAKKFEGLIKAMPEDGAYSASVASSLQHFEDYKDIMQSMQQLGHEFPNEKAKAIYIEAMRFKQFFVKQDVARQWEEFCYYISQKPHVEMLSKLLFAVAQNNCHSEFCNIFFSTAFKERLVRNEEALKKMYYDFFGSISRIDAELVDAIRAMAQDVEKWREPENFTKLHTDLKQRLNIVEQKLKFDATHSLLEQRLYANLRHDFIDAWDLSVKALMTSTSYSGAKYTQQLENSYTLIKTIYDHFETYAMNTMKTPNLQSVHVDYEEFYSDYIRDIKNILNNLDIAKGGLVPSADFSLNAFTFGRLHGEAYDARIQHTKSMADIHMLMHQGSYDALALEISTATSVMQHLVPDTVYKACCDFTHDCVTRGSTGRLYFEVTYLSHNVEGSTATFKYNIILRNHGATLAVRYNYATQKVGIALSIFTLDADADNLVLNDLASLLELNCNIKQYPTLKNTLQACDEKLDILLLNDKYRNTSYEYDVECNVNDTAQVLNLVWSSVNASMTIHQDESHNAESLMNLNYAICTEYSTRIEKMIKIIKSLDGKSTSRKSCFDYAITKHELGGKFDVLEYVKANKIALLRSQFFTQEDLKILADSGINIQKEIHDNMHDYLSLPTFFLEDFQAIYNAVTIEELYEYASRDCRSLKSRCVIESEDSTCAFAKFFNDLNNSVFDMVMQRSHWNPGDKGRLLNFISHNQLCALGFKPSQLKKHILFTHTDVMEFFQLISKNDYLLGSGEVQNIISNVCAGIDDFVEYCSVASALGGFDLLDYLLRTLSGWKIKLHELTRALDALHSAGWRIFDGYGDAHFDRWINEAERLYADKESQYAFVNKYCADDFVREQFQKHWQKKYDVEILRENQLKLHATLPQEMRQHMDDFIQNNYGVEYEGTVQKDNDTLVSYWNNRGMSYLAMAYNITTQKMSLNITIQDGFDQSYLDGIVIDSLHLLYRTDIMSDIQFPGKKNGYTLIHGMGKKLYDHTLSFSAEHLKDVFIILNDILQSREKYYNDPKINDNDIIKSVHESLLQGVHNAQNDAIVNILKKYLSSNYMRDKHLTHHSVFDYVINKYEQNELFNICEYAKDHAIDTSFLTAEDECILHKDIELGGVVNNC